MKSLAIGTVVRISAVTQGKRNGETRTLERIEIEPIFAQTTGVARIATGKYLETSQPTVEGNKVKFHEVRVGLSNKPVLVADEDLEVADREVAAGFALPFVRNNAFKAVQAA